MAFIRYNTIFILCNWDSTRWQGSVNLKNGKETAINRSRNNNKTIQRHRIHKIETNIKNMTEREREREKGRQSKVGEYVYKNQSSILKKGTLFSTVS
jgi:hypothetical protein